MNNLWNVFWLPWAVIDERYTRWAMYPLVVLKSATRQGVWSGRDSNPH